MRTIPSQHINFRLILGLFHVSFAVMFLEKENNQTIVLKFFILKHPDGLFKEKRKPFLIR